MGPHAERDPTPAGAGGPGWGRGGKGWAAAAPAQLPGTASPLAGDGAQTCQAAGTTTQATWAGAGTAEQAVGLRVPALPLTGGLTSNPAFPHP